ncbi:proton gradient regulation protein, putative [Medicago truncatula]|uniref:Proton gradient regulation protein, putative n=1 Tax=Medicago truncatula TaxID=3880 RepID=G7J345_MEDTR|nr:proton gradient regulation protein, putative [Medicago truncatula]
MKSHQHNVAISLFKKLNVAGVRPDVITMNIIINSLVQVANLKMAKCILGKSVILGLEPDVWTFATLFRGYSVVGAMELHHKLVDSGFVLNQVTYGTLIEGLCRREGTNAAINLLYGIS